MASTSNSSAVVTKGKWHVGPRNAGVDLVGTKTGAGRLLVLFGHDETLQRRSATATLGCRRFVAVRIDPQPVAGTDRLLETAGIKVPTKKRQIAD
jgi:hypothetical protein